MIGRDWSYNVILHDDHLDSTLSRCFDNRPVQLLGFAFVLDEIEEQKKTRSQRRPYKHTRRGVGDCPPL